MVRVGGNLSNRAEIAPASTMQVLGSKFVVLINDQLPDSRMSDAIHGL
jgi:hypothetical protein